MLGLLALWEAPQGDSFVLPARQEADLVNKLAKLIKIFFQNYLSTDSIFPEYNQSIFILFSCFGELSSYSDPLLLTW